MKKERTTKARDSFGKEMTLYLGTHRGKTKGEQCLWARNPNLWYKQHSLGAIKTFAGNPKFRPIMLWLLESLVRPSAKSRSERLSALEIGGGRFPLISDKSFRQRFGRLAFVDVSPENLAVTRRVVSRVKKPKQFIECDVRNPEKIPKGKYDVCVMNEVFTHIPLKAQVPILRQLAAKGIKSFLITDRYSRGTYSGNVDWAVLARALKTIGFEVEVHDHSAYTSNWFFLTANKSGKKQIIVHEV